MNADLHCHSTVSDGTLAPAEVARRAAANGVDLWSLTDHDVIDGQEEALETARACGMDYLTGVEISVTFAGKTVHIVGLGFDHQNTDLREGLARVRGGRQRRGQLIAERLAQLGFPNAYEGALRYATDPEGLSRTHFARYLMETGRFNDVNEIFHQLLGDGKPACVPDQWATLAESVQWIRNAGGMAIIAHPARYGFSPNAEFALFDEFKIHGGQGVEVVTGSHRPHEYPIYADMAREFSLSASRGSDFHDPVEAHVDLGGLPHLPPDLIPVWQVLQPRIHLAH
ncbi:MAG: hypothetical protein RLZZ397_925 [Pseudomonadota bacterium]|jgi:predicted metal-dependent phosphoesterase TrpH